MQRKREHVRCRARVIWVFITHFILTLASGEEIFAQSVLKGRVTSFDTGLGIESASMAILGTGGGTSTDSEGYFSLQIPVNATQIRISAIGFKEKIINWVPTTDSLFITLETSTETIEEVVVTARSRYSNQNNPAVDLIHEIIGHKSQNNTAYRPHLSYQVYEKIMMAASDLPDMVSQNSLFKNYRFVFDNIDTTLSPGRKLLPIYLEENLRKEYRRAHSSMQKTIVEATIKTELDRRFINNDNIQTSIAYLHKEVNLYDNNLLLFNRSFLSPIAASAPLFYKYQIQDTTILNDNAYILVEFIPRNAEDRLFSGQLWVSTDGKYAIKKAVIKLDGRANINWVNDTQLTFEYKKTENDEYFPDQMEMKTNFGLSGSGQGMFSHWTLHYQEFDHAPQPNHLFGGKPIAISAGAADKGEDFWDINRPYKLSEREQVTYDNIDSLERNKSFKRALSWGAFLTTSYVHLGGIELGPFEYAYSLNDLEGNRFRLGGRTTREMSDKFYAEAYTAYGTKDQQWKYFIGAGISLKNERIAQFPAHYLHASYQYDAREPGQRMDFLNGDSFLRSFRSGDQDKWLYNTNLKLSHVIEFGNHWRLESMLGLHNQTPAGTMEFRRVRDSVRVESIQYTDFGIDLRWAPFEEFFQRNLVRSPISNQHPIFNLRYNMGLKDVFGGEYEYHAFRFDVSKRFFLSQLGITDVKAGGGYIIGSLPYSLLEIPMANQTYLLAQDSYNLMNDLEFVSDQFAKFSIEHNFQGFILNKIPLIKRLKIREVLGFKMFVGDLRPENQPYANTNRFYFPVNKDGIQTTFGLGGKPYMEASFGLENIFRVLRVEYVKRLSYQNHPGVKAEGLRFSTKIGF